MGRRLRSNDGAKTWARIASLIGTCKLNGVNPFDGLTRPHCGHGPISPYIAATLRKILDNHMQRKRPLSSCPGTSANSQAARPGVVGQRLQRRGACRGTR